jgi:hypothetical protein
MPKAGLSASRGPDALARGAGCGPSIGKCLLSNESGAAAANAKQADR